MFNMVNQCAQNMLIGVNDIKIQKHGKTNGWVYNWCDGNYGVVGHYYSTYTGIY